MYGFGGDDTITGDTSIENLYGGSGNDTIIGSFAADNIYGGFGDDVIHADYLYSSFTDISGKTFWVDASDLTNNGRGSTDAGLLNAISDKAGSNDLAQSSDSLKPNYDLTGINGRPSMYFDGGDYVFKSDASLSITDDFTAFIVKKEEDGAPQANRHFFNARGETGEGDTGIDLYWGDGINNSKFIVKGSGSWGDDFINASGTVTTGENSFTTYVRSNSGANMEIFKNSSSIGTDTGGGNISFGSGNLRIDLGWKKADSGNYYKGDIAEIIIYNRDLSASERGIVENYLASKYEINFSAALAAADSLTGDSGSDTFVFSNTAHATDSNADVITDFNQSNSGTYSANEGDIIQFEFDQTLTLNTDNSFTGLQNELIWRDDGSGNVYIEIDWDGNSSADFRTQLQDGGTADFSQSNISATSFQFKRVIGSSGADTLKGTSSADTLEGGAGIDNLSGQGGNDNFYWTNSSDTGTGSGSRDIIADFKQSSGSYTTLELDQLDLTNHSLTFIGSNSFSTTPGEIRFTDSGSNTIAEISLDSNQTSDMEIQLTGNMYLYGDEFTGVNDTQTFSATTGTDNLDNSSSNDYAVFEIEANEFNTTGGSLDDAFLGGSNVDTLRFLGGETIDFTVLTNLNSAIEDMERIDLATGTASNTIKLNLEDVADITDANNLLYFDGDSNDTVQLEENIPSWTWTQGSDVEVLGINYNVYTTTFAHEVRVHEDVNVDLNV